MSKEPRRSTFDRSVVMGETMEQCWDHSPYGSPKKKRYVPMETIKKAKKEPTRKKCQECAISVSLKRIPLIDCWLTDSIKGLMVMMKWVGFNSGFYVNLENSLNALVNMMPKLLEENRLTH